MSDFEQGSVQANNLLFHYLEMGEGPLALCLHGFPDSPFTYRHLLPELAAAGYRAVAPFMRGFAPTEVPAERSHVHSSTLVADAVGLHEALGGDGDAVLIAHDWGACAAWGAAALAPGRWRRLAVMNIPPFDLFGENLLTYNQIKRSFFFWFFQMQEVIVDFIAADNFAFVDHIWADWSPGYDGKEDLPHVKQCLSDRPNLETALGYYWAQFDPVRFGSSTWAEEQRAAWGGAISNSVLYLHGANDGCHSLDAKQVASVPSYLGEGSRSELIDGVGKYLMLERPEEINKRIVEFLRG
jgi:pimeloyl-ACP methyl ester carboxylesterase